MAVNIPFSDNKDIHIDTPWVVENTWNSQENSSITKIIEDFETSNDFVRLSYAEILKDIKNKLSTENLNDLSNILNRLANAWDNERITELMKELAQATENYVQEWSAVNEDANDKETWILEWLKGIIWLGNWVLNAQSQEWETKVFNTLPETDDDEYLRSTAIAPAEISDDTDYAWNLFLNSIQESFIQNESLNENQLVSQINEIVLTRSIDKNDIDSHFDDLLDARQNKEEWEKIQKFISLYKSESTVYKKLDSWEVLSLSEIDSQLNEAAKLINDSRSTSPFRVEMWGDSWEFQSKKEALLTIYQLKLHLNEMEPYMLPYFFEEYAWIIATWIWSIAAVLAVIAWPAILYRYVRDRFNDQIDRINEWLTKNDIKRLTNNENTGVLDETIKIFQENWIPDEDIKNLKTLSIYLSATQSEQTSDAWVQLLKDNSDAYRQFARFRGSVWYFVSWFYSINKQIWMHTDKNWKIVRESPFKIRNLTWLIVWSINKWPEGWDVQTQRQVFENYIVKFREFNGMIGKVDEIMKWQNIWWEARGKIRKDILSLFTTDLPIPVLRPNRTRPLQNKFPEIQKILENGWVNTSWSDFKLLERRIKWEVIPEISNRINHIKDIITFHPEIDDTTERKFLEKIDWLEHSETEDWFNKWINDFISNNNINGVSNHDDIRNISILWNVKVSKEELGILKESILTNSPNKIKIDDYLEHTTPWHKWLIYLNIARIMRWEAIISSITLEQAESISTAFKSSSIKQIWRILLDNYKTIILDNSWTSSNSSQNESTKDSDSNTNKEDTTWTDRSSSEKPAEEEPTQRSAPRESSEWITDYKSLKKYLDEIYPSILMSWDEEAIQQINDEFTKISSYPPYLTLILDSPNIEDRYRNQFRSIEIFKVQELGNLSAIRIRLSEIDNSFAGISKFTDIWARIASLWSTDAWRLAREALQWMKVRK